MIKINAEEISCKTCKTSDCFIKSNCNNDWIDRISTLKETSLFRENQYIIHEGNEVLGLYFIQNGKVKIVSSGLAGKSQSVRLTKQGDIIGHRGYGGETYPISAVTLEHSVVCFIDNETIYQAFMENPKLTYQLMMYYSKELRKSESKIKAHAQMNVREKVADALISFYSLFKDQDDQSPLNLSRIDISDYAGINTEQLSRVLSDFKKEGVIAIDRNSIVIQDMDSLDLITLPFGLIK